MFETNWACAWAWFQPPMMPKATRTSPLTIIQAALEAARVTKLTFAGCDVTMESRVPASTRLALAEKGHDIDLQGAFSSLVGGGQSVMRDYAAGVNSGASDPRKDGAAIPEPLF